MNLTASKQRIFIIEERANPSTDFFVLPAALSCQAHIIRCRFNELASVAELSGATVLFVRYIPNSWAKLVTKARKTLASVVLFMDDDVLDIQASRGTPWLYRLKLARLSACKYNWLKQQQAELWVSTPYLQQKYADWPAKLLLPSPIGAQTDLCRVFYHGTASHRADIRWLQPVIDQALRQDSRLVFEIIGDHRVNRLYRKLPRVNVIHTMQWPSYQAFLGLQPRHIGLNPLLPSPFNQARSYTKFFDITRCGAVGIYSPNSICADIISHQHDGLIVDLDQQAWVDAIIQLANNPPLRQTLLNNAEEKVKNLAEQARQSHQGLLD